MYLQNRWYSFYSFFTRVLLCLVTDSADEEEVAASGSDYNYLLNMAILSLSKEKKDELLKQRDTKVTLDYLRFQYPWSTDICILLWCLVLSWDMSYATGFSPAQWEWRSAKPILRFHQTETWANSFTPYTSPLQKLVSTKGFSFIFTWWQDFSQNH